MTHCPNCGKEQGHIHLGWRYPLSSTICARRVDCPNCKSSFIIFEFKKETEEVKELYRVTDEFIQPDDTRPCSLGC